MFNTKSEDACHYKVITKEFLESVLGYQVDKFTVENATKPGDNFMSALCSITVQVKAVSARGLEDERKSTQLLSPSSHAISASFQEKVKETRYYLLKCYPSDSSQQKFLNKVNHFYTELYFYNTLAKDLVQFQKENMDTPVSLAFPPFHGGKAVNFQDSRNVSQPDAEKIYSPVDNYILMTDMRKTFGYRMTGRAMDIDHMKLAITELASMHAVSWAYMKNKSLESGNLQEKYPFLKRPPKSRKTDTWLNILKESTNQAVEAIDTVKGLDNFLSKSIQQFCARGRTVMDYFFSAGEMEEIRLRQLLKTQTGNAEETVHHWRVVCHGDIWSNNLLFQYNEKTGKPERVVLVDFPLVKLACPTLDLACIVYTSTRAKLRHMHLDECLQLYHDRFFHVCKQMKVDSLPGFNMDSLKSKFRASTLVGLLIAVISFPQDLKTEENENNQEMDQLKRTGDKAAVGNSELPGEKETLYQKWIVELVQDAYNEGII